jgi:hypothetical protein
MPQARKCDIVILQELSGSTTLKRDCVVSITSE